MPERPPQYKSITRLRDEKGDPLDSLLGGLIRTSIGPAGRCDIQDESKGASEDPGDCTFESDWAAHRTEDRDGWIYYWSYYLGADSHGHQVIREECGCDGRTLRLNYLAPEAIAMEWATKYAADAGVTVEDAKNWLREWGPGKHDMPEGHYGSDLYALILQANENPSEQE